MKRDSKIASPSVEQSEAREWDKEKRQTKCVMPRDSDTSFALEEGQFKAKKGGIAVDEVSTDRLMV